MYENILRPIILILKRFGINFIGSDLHELLSENHRIIQLGKILNSKAPNDIKTYLLTNLLDSNSQLLQDLVAHYINGFQKGGFFVEIGAYDGIINSNTLLLEKNFEYQGILVEPAISVRNQIIKNRACKIEYSAISSKSEESVEFFECSNLDLSTLHKYKETDHLSTSRKKGKKYNVNTLSLLDLLEKYDAPNVISYLSIDTEGSELDIIDNFDFSKYSFNFISIEHNYGKNREKIFRILSEKGYKRIFNEFSEWDDWYIINN
jgi:FkbM family methyltransferase